MASTAPSLPRPTSGWIVGASALVLLASGPADVGAQERSALTVSGGPAPYDLSGTGTAWVAGAEVSRALVGRMLWAEAGTRLFSYQSQGESTITHLFPEAGLRLQLPVGPIRPYVGAGAGGSLVIEGRSDTEVTLHALVGLRIDANPNWHLRPEMRIRSVDPWTGTVADFALGVGYRF